MDADQNGWHVYVDNEEDSMTNIKCGVHDRRWVKDVSWILKGLMRMTLTWDEMRTNTGTVAPAHESGG